MQGSGSNVKVVNSVAKCMHGVVTTMMQVGDWYGSCELVAMPLNNFYVIVGLDFIRRAKVAVIPYFDGLMIHDEYAPCFVRAYQDGDGTVALTSLQVHDILQRGEVMYLATMHEVIA